MPSSTGTSTASIPRDSASDGRGRNHYVVHSKGIPKIWSRGNWWVLLFFLFHSLFHSLFYSIFHCFLIAFCALLWCSHHLIFFLFFSLFFLFFLGAISTDHLEAVVIELQEPMTRKELEDMKINLDITSTGMVGFQDFHDFWTNANWTRKKRKKKKCQGRQLTILTKKKTLCSLNLVSCSHVCTIGVHMYYACVCV